MQIKTCHRDLLKVQSWISSHEFLRKCEARSTHVRFYKQFGPASGMRAVETSSHLLFATNLCALMHALLFCCAVTVLMSITPSLPLLPSFVSRIRYDVTLLGSDAAEWLMLSADGVHTAAQAQVSLERK